MQYNTFLFAFPFFVCLHLRLYQTFYNILRINYLLLQKYRDKTRKSLEPKYMFKNVLNRLLDKKLF